MQQHGSKYIARRHPPPTHKKSTFSEHGHFAYRTECNREYSNMVANILPADTPPTLGWGQKVEIQLFQNMVMSHIKQNEITNAAT